MQNQINLVQGDTGPDLTVCIYDSVSNEVIDLSDPGTTVRMHVLNEQTGQVTTITGSKDTGGSDGVVTFSWPSGLFSSVGYYEAEVEMSMASGKLQTVPEKIRIYVRKQIA